MQDSPFAISPGPGSFSESDGPSCFSMPDSMRTFSVPSLPEPDVVRDLEKGRELLAKVLAATRAWSPGQAAARFELLVLPTADRALIDQVLGEGEVSARVHGQQGVSASLQESVLAGIWRVRESTPEGRCLSDRIEVCDLPGCLVDATRSLQERMGDLPPLGPGVVNAPGVLAEILALLDAGSDGSQTARTHSINLSLLPFGPADDGWLDTCLGSGTASILARGYGNCRIDATALRRVWRVRYFNSQDVPILESIDIADCPEIARAAPEDIADSALRLSEIIDWLA